MKKATIRLLSAALFVSMAASMNMMETELQCNLVITRVQFIASDGTTVTAFEGSENVDLFSDDVQSSDGTRLFNTPLPDGTYTDMIITIGSVVLEQSGQTQDITNELVENGFSLSVRFSSNATLINDGTAEPMNEFTIGGSISDMPSIDFNCYFPEDSVSGDSIGDFTISSVPTFEAGGSGSGFAAGGTLSVTIDGTSAGLPVFVGLFKSSSLSEPPKIGGKFNGNEGTTNVVLNVPFGTYFVGAAQVTDPSRDEPNPEFDKFGMYGIDGSSFNPKEVILSSSNPTASISITIASRADMEGKFGKQGMRGMFNPCPTRGTNTVTATVRLGYFTAGHEKVFGMLLKLPSGTLSCGSLGTTTYAGCVNAIQGASGPTKFQAFGSMMAGIMQQNERDSCSIVFAFAAVTPGTTSETKVEFKEVPEGNWFAMALFDINGNQRPDAGESIGWLPTVISIVGGNRLYAAGTIPIEPNNANSFTFIEGPPPGGGGGPPPGPFNLSLPANGATGVPTTPKLEWTDASNEDSYTLQISTNNGFSSILYNKDIPANTVSPVSHLVPPGTLLPNTTYYWRVWAKNGSGQSPPSNAPFFSFRTAPPPP